MISTHIKLTYFKYVNYYNNIDYISMQRNVNLALLILTIWVT